MSNLGLYQTMTVLAKKVGGPGKLAALVIGGSMVAGGVILRGYDRVRAAISAKKVADNERNQLTTTYVVCNEGTSDEGVLLRVGDQFKVLERDGDAVLIEILGDDENPYFVSVEFLSGISDYAG